MANGKYWQTKYAKTCLPGEGLDKTVQKSDQSSYCRYEVALAPSQFI